MAILITAHSGAEGTPANSLEYIKTALSLGVDALEIDIRPVGGELRLTHDAPGAGQDAPLLETCLDMFADSSVGMLNCDMKTAGSVEAVLELARARGICERLVFTGDDISPREQQAIAEAGAQWWMNVQPEELASPAAALECLRARGAGWINSNYRFYTPEMIHALHDAGMRISAWTVDNEADMRRMLACGVDNITTRHPRMALEMRTKAAVI